MPSHSYTKCDFELSPVIVQSTRVSFELFAGAGVDVGADVMAKLNVGDKVRISGYEITAAAEIKAISVSGGFFEVHGWPVRVVDGLYRLTVNEQIENVLGDVPFITLMGSKAAEFIKTHTQTQDGDLKLQLIAKLKSEPNGDPTVDIYLVPEVKPMGLDFSAGGNTGFYATSRKFAR